jgi:hypothetical protein
MKSEAANGGALRGKYSVSSQCLIATRDSGRRPAHWSPLGGKVKVSQVNKIEIIRTASGSWHASVQPHGPWACYRTPEKAFKKLMAFLRNKKK